MSSEPLSLAVAVTRNSRRNGVGVHGGRKGRVGSNKKIGSGTSIDADGASGLLKGGDTESRYTEGIPIARVRQEKMPETPYTKRNVRVHDRRSEVLLAKPKAFSEYAHNLLNEYYQLKAFEDAVLAGRPKWFAGERYLHLGKTQSTKKWNEIVEYGGAFPWFACHAVLGIHQGKIARGYETRSDRYATLFYNTLAQGAKAWPDYLRPLYEGGTVTIDPNEADNKRIPDYVIDASSTLLTKDGHVNIPKYVNAESDSYLGREKPSNIHAFLGEECRDYRVFSSPIWE